MNVISGLQQSLVNKEETGIIDISTYFRRIIQSLMPLNRYSYVVKYNIAFNSLDINMAMPCGFIVNEIVSYYFSVDDPTGKGGKIYISLKYDDQGVYELRIKNSSCPLPQELASKNPKLMRFQIIKIITAQLKGEIRISGEFEFICSFKEVQLRTYSIL